MQAFQLIAMRCEWIEKLFLVEALRDF